MAIVEIKANSSLKSSMSENARFQIQLSYLIRILKVIFRHLRVGS